ncbi:MAG: ATP-binding protein [Nitratireductor sp.]
MNKKLNRLTKAVSKIGKAAKIKKLKTKKADAFVWDANENKLAAVKKVNRVDIDLLKGIDPIKETLTQNTLRFAKGLPANNVLLWGARGMGKSSLVKAAHASINHSIGGAANEKLKLIEIHREDINSLPTLLNLIRKSSARFILYCDDLSFDNNDSSYKSLKAALDGGVEGRPENVIFYATSNRRHLLPRDMMENESSTAINPSESVEEKVSLSDRFGLWLGFHKCTQDDYLDIVYAYANHFKLEVEKDSLKAQALEWSTTRGARSGRVAWQFIQDLAGKLEKQTIS